MMKNVSTVLAVAITSLALALATSAAADTPGDEARPLPFAAAPTSDEPTPSSWNVTQLLFHAPGERTTEVLTVFRLHLTHVVPLPWRSLRNRLRPYVLGGRTSVRLPAGRGLTRYADAYEESSTLHLGGGTELLLGDRLSLSIDLGEVIHSGSLSGQSYERYNLGVAWDF